MVNEESTNEQNEQTASDAMAADAELENALLLPLPLDPETALENALAVALPLALESDSALPEPDPESRENPLSVDTIDADVSPESAPELAPPTPAEPGTLPDLLDRLTSRVAVDRIEEIWVFPPRKAGFGDSTVFAVSAFDADPERRRILTARFSVTKDPKGQPVIEEAIDEQGTAPADRVSRVIEGVLRRLGDDLTAVPRHFRIGGDFGEWNRLREG